jgi:hypothetical protein
VPPAATPLEVRAEAPSARDALLEQIADRGAAVGEQLLRVLAVDVLREDHQGKAGALRADRQRSPETVVGVAGRHPNVRDDEIRVVCRHELRQIRCLVGDAGHVDAGLPENEHQALAQERLVLADHNAHGTSAATIVPHPGSLSWPWSFVRVRRGQICSGAVTCLRPPPSCSEEGTAEWS